MKQEIAQNLMAEIGDLRQRAEAEGFSSLAYLLALAEQEASDLRQDRMPECQPQKADGEHINEAR